MVPPLAQKSGDTKLFVTEKPGPVAGDRGYLSVCGISRRSVLAASGWGCMGRGVTAEVVSGVIRSGEAWR